MKYFCLIICVFIAANTHAQRAAVRIIDNVLVELSALADTIIIQQLDDGETVPTGYEAIARGKWRAGPATMKCDERTFKKLTVEKAREIGATHYRLYDYRGPIPIVTTCPGSKVLFLRKRE